MLKLCSHPLLVVGDRIPDSLLPVLSELVPANSDIGSELHKLYHSPKLVALQEIMEECGIGVDASSSEGAITFGQHRVLIFAQHKVMDSVSLVNYNSSRALGFSHFQIVFMQALLDIIEKDLFHTHMKK